VARILLTEDDEIMRITLYDRLKANGWDVDAAADGKEALALMEENAYQLVISDIRMPGMDGISLLERIARISASTDVILMTAYGRVEDAVDCLKKGAADYILKPFDMDDLTIRVRRLLGMQKMKVKCAMLEEGARRQTITGDSPAIRNVLRTVAQVAGTDSTVLITGESGTGKELVAAAIHYQSPRSGNPYIRINCGAIPDNLMEAELFGHEKGAFTGAQVRRAGKFEMADGGTLLLDEIGDLPLHLQVKLLRVIEERAVERIGGGRPVPVDVRLICATAKDLKEETQQGRFREDLFYRLQVIPIWVPPLRDRREDIPKLCDGFLEEFSRRRTAPLRLTSEALEILRHYAYPGNIRELRNIIERVSVLVPGPVIGPDDLPQDLRGQQPQPVAGGVAGRFSLAQTVADAEGQCIRMALGESRGNKTEAARLLGISRKNLWEKMKLHRISPDAT